MSNRIGIIVLGILILSAVIVSTCTMIVPEYESVVLTEFGDPVGDPLIEPGLKLVMPWYERHIFPKRLLRWDGDRSQIPTRDKRFIWVDASARWKIVDPLLFLRAVNTVKGAQTRLDDVIDSAVRTIISDNELIELVRSDRDLVGLPTESTDTVTAANHDASAVIEKGRIALQEEVVRRANTKTETEYGIKVVDVRIKRINYIEEVQANIFNRMIAERKKVAERYRSEGKGQAAEILGVMERDLERIRSEAFRKAREIEGQADAEAARIFAEAYGADVEFYTFIATLETWERGIGKGHRTRLVLGTDGDLLRYLRTPLAPSTVAAPALKSANAPAGAR
jgi:modulator of FtsH protease HflC